MSDMVNMLDKFPTISSGEVCPRIIIRVVTGSNTNLDPGPQHLGDFTDAFKEMFSWVNIVELKEPEEILSVYKNAILGKDSRSTIIIEYGSFYSTK